MAASPDWFSRALGCSAVVTNALQTTIAAGPSDAQPKRLGVQHELRFFPATSPKSTVKKSDLADGRGKVDGMK
jgi:hypothetical protein